MRITRLAAIGAASALIISGLATTPASAATFSASLSKSIGLTAAADTINITLNNLDGDKGVYLRLCEVPANKTERPKKCDGQGKWVSNLLASQVMGAGKADQVTALPVRAVFTAEGSTVDCTAVACAVHVRRDHFGGAADTSLDRYYPVSFGAASATATAKAGKLTVVIAGAYGQQAAIKVGSKTYTRTITNNKYTFTIAVPKNKEVKVSAVVARKALVSKTLKG